DCLPVRALESLGLPRLRHLPSPQTRRAAAKDMSQATVAVLRLALQESFALAHNYIGTEHLLLGLAGLPEKTMVRAMRSKGIDVDEVRRTVIRLVTEATGVARSRRRRRSTSHG